MQKIMDGLYIGNAEDQENISTEIESVLNLRRTVYTPPAHLKAFLQVPWYYIDDPDHLSQYHQAVVFVETQHRMLRRRTLVHCCVGVDRTLGVILGYLMRGGRSYEDAKAYVDSLNLALPREPVPEVIEAVKEYGRHLKEAPLRESPLSHMLARSGQQWEGA